MFVTNTTIRECSCFVVERKMDNLSTCHHRSLTVLQKSIAIGVANAIHLVSTVAAAAAAASTAVDADLRAVRL